MKFFFHHSWWCGHYACLVKATIFLRFRGTASLSCPEDTISQQNPQSFSFYSLSVPSIGCSLSLKCGSHVVDVPVIGSQLF